MQCLCSSLLKDTSRVRFFFLIFSLKMDLVLIFSVDSVRSKRSQKLVKLATVLDTGSKSWMIIAFCHVDGIPNSNKSKISSWGSSVAGWVLDGWGNFNNIEFISCTRPTYWRMVISLGLRKNLRMKRFWVCKARAGKICLVTAVITTPKFTTVSPPVVVVAACSKAASASPSSNLRARAYLEGPVVAFCPWMTLSRLLRKRSHSSGVPLPK